MSRAKNIGRAAARGFRGTAIGGVTGAASYYAHKFAAEKVGMIGSNWWAGPAIMLGAGHFLKMKGKTAGIGMSLCGAAGYAGAMAYSAKKATETTQGLQGQQGGPFGEASGFQNPGDPYALSDNNATDASWGTSAYDTDADEAPAGGSVASAMAL